MDDFTTRMTGIEIPEIMIAYEALWHNMAKTMVSAEWSCWLEGKDEEVMTIVIGRKIDKKMI